MLSHSRLVFSSLSPITVKGNVPADGGGGGALRRQAGGFEFEANLITEQILGQPGVLHRETMSQITKTNKQKSFLLKAFHLSIEATAQARLLIRALSPRLLQHHTPAEQLPLFALFTNTGPGCLSEKNGNSAPLSKDGHPII